MTQSGPAQSSTAARPTIAVVLPARNAADTIERQLHALGAQDYADPWELIVVDNGSSDATRRILERWADHGAGLTVVGCEQVGINHARNAGVNAARAPLIACCDADDEVTPGWLGSIATALQAFDIAGGPLSIDELNDEVVRHSRPNIVPSELPIALGHLPYAVGANMGFRRATFDAIGGFDGTFTLGSDEVDFCWRAQQAGYRIGFAPDALVHYRFKSEPRALMRQFYVYAQADAQLYAKHQQAGTLAPRSRAQQLRSISLRSRTLLRVDRLARSRDRAAYLRRLGAFAGSLAGFARYRILL